MSEEYPDFSIYHKVLGPKAKAGPSQHFSRTQAEGEDRKYKSKRFQDGSEDDEWWFNPVFKSLGLNKTLLLQNLQFMLVGVVGTVVGLPALGGSILYPRPLYSAENTAKTFLESAKVLVRPQQKGYQDLIQHNLQLKEGSADSNSLSLLQDQSQISSNEPAAKILERMDHNVNLLLQAAEVLKQSRKSDPIIEIGVQAFVGVEKDLSPKNNSTANDFDVATGQIPGQFGLGPVKPVAKLGVYCNVPIFRK